MPRPNKGPRLEQNEHGVWEVRWSEAGRSRRVSTRSTDRQEAARFLAGFILEIEKQKDEQLTVDRVLDVYLAEHVERGPVIDKVRQRNIARNLRPFFGHMTPDQISPEQIEKFSRLRSVGNVGIRRARSSGTLRRELNMLRAAFNHMVRTKRLAATAAPYIPLPAAPGAKDLWLTEDESDQFAAAAAECSERGHLFVSIAANTASRRRAIEVLTWPQVDMERRLIHFNPPGRAQSKKRRVAVPINDALFQVLAMVPPEKRQGFVLGHPGSVTRAFEAVCRRAATRFRNPKFLKVTPHTLRHTWATLAARAGVDLYEIAGVLGDTLETVQTNYLHHCPDHLRKAVNFRKAA